MNSIENEERLKIYEVLLVWSVILVSIVTSIIILFDTDRPVYYEWLPVLPLSFGVLNALFYRVYYRIFDKLAYMVIIAVYGIRNVITPLIMFFGAYEGKFKLLNTSNVNRALALMIYETAIIFLILMFYNDKLAEKEEEAVEENPDTQGTSQLFKIILGVLCLFCVFAYIQVPQINANYMSIFESSKVVELVRASKLFVAGSYKRILYTLFTFCFNIAQLFVCVACILKIRKSLGESFLSILCAIGIILSNFLFISGETGYTFILIVILCLIAFKLYPESGMKFLALLGVMFVVGVVTVCINKSSISTTTSDSAGAMGSMMFQAYFPGVCNMAGIFNIENSSKLTTLFYDFYSMIPFRNTLFGIEGNETLVNLYTYQNNAACHIIPCVGQAYHYLGFILAPVVSGFFAWIGIKAQNKLNTTNNIWKYSVYLLLCLYACLSPVMYNATIFGAKFLGVIIPMLIIAKTSDRKQCENQEEAYCDLAIE